MRITLAGVLVSRHDRKKERLMIGCFRVKVDKTIQKLDYDCKRMITRWDEDRKSWKG
jgi:hypothetical protein